VSEELMKIEKKMTTDSHKRDNRGSEENQNKRKVKKEVVGSIIAAIMLQLLGLPSLILSTR